MKQAEVTKVQEKEKALSEAFQETVADNPFEEFLTRVFKKMVKRNKEKDRNGGGKKWLHAVLCAAVYIPASVFHQFIICLQKTKTVMKTLMKTLMTGMMTLTAARREKHP